MFVEKHITIDESSSSSSHQYFSNNVEMNKRPKLDNDQLPEKGDTDVLQNSLIRSENDRKEETNEMRVATDSLSKPPRQAIKLGLYYPDMNVDSDSSTEDSD